MSTAKETIYPVEPVDRSGRYLCSDGYWHWVKVNPNGQKLVHHQRFYC